MVKKAILVDNDGNFIKHFSKAKRKRISYLEPETNKKIDTMVCMIWFKNLNELHLFLYRHRGILWPVNTVNHSLEKVADFVIRVL